MLNQSSTWKCTREETERSAILKAKKEEKQLHSGTISPVKGPTHNAVPQYLHMLADSSDRHLQVPLGPYKSSNNSVVVKQRLRNTHKCDSGN